MAEQALDFGHARAVHDARGGEAMPERVELDAPQRSALERRGEAALVHGRAAHIAAGFAAARRREDEIERVGRLLQLPRFEAHEHLARQRYLAVAGGGLRR